MTKLNNNRVTSPSYKSTKRSTTRKPLDSGSSLLRLVTEALPHPHRWSGAIAIVSRVPSPESVPSPDIASELASLVAVMSSHFWVKVRRFFSLLDTSGNGTIEPSGARAKMTKVLLALHKQQRAHGMVDEFDVKNAEDQGASCCLLSLSLSLSPSPVSFPLPPPQSRPPSSNVSSFVCFPLSHCASSCFRALRQFRAPVLCRTLDDEIENEVAATVQMLFDGAVTFARSY